MRPFCNRAVRGLTVSAVLLMAPTPVDAGDPLVFAGSGSNVGIVRRLAEAYRRAHPDVTIEVPPSIGSTGGIRAAASGAIAVGLISRPLRPPEAGLGLTVVPFARTPVVIAAHPGVIDDGLTLDDLVAIYRGERTRWRDGREIIVLTREPGDSSIEVLERAVPGFKEAYADSHRLKRWTVLATDQEMTRVLAKTPYALGLSDAGAMATEQLAIKALAVNGVPPSAESVAGSRYPLVKELAFAFRGDRVPAAARAFMDFVGSPDGRTLLRRYGYLPPA